jgi:HTH-type transcriptional regulator/antitoxin HipB
MDDIRLGNAIRLVRQRRGWRQQDLAQKSGVSQSAVSRIELGRIGPQSIDTLRKVAAALEIRIDLVPRWRAGDLDRLVSGRHSALNESVARMFRDQLPEWVLAPEVSFAIYRDRGVIDILAWHPGSRSLLVIELKTELVDINETIGTLDRKRRLARQIARERGWDPVRVSAWLIVSASRTNRRRADAHEAMLSAALPDDNGAIRRWLREPAGPIGPVGAISFWTDTRGVGARQGLRPIRRVRVASRRRSERGSKAGKVGVTAET